MWSDKFKFGYENWMGLVVGDECNRVSTEERWGYLVGKSMAYNSAVPVGVEPPLISMYDLCLEAQSSPEQMLELLHDVWGSHLCPTLAREVCWDEDLCPFCCPQL